MSNGNSLISTSPFSAFTRTALATRSATTSDSSVTPASSAFASSMLRPLPNKIPTNLVLPPYTVTYKSPAPITRLFISGAPCITNNFLISLTACPNTAA